MRNIDFPALDSKVWSRYKKTKHRTLDFKVGKSISKLENEDNKTESLQIETLPYISIFVVIFYNLKAETSW